MASVDLTMRIGTGPAVYALRRLDELSEAGRITPDDLYGVAGGAVGFARDLVEWRAQPGALILHPTDWVQALIERAGAV